MCKPLPLEHAAAEPWLQFLQAQKIGPQSGRYPRGLLADAPAPRTLTEAVVDRVENFLRYGQSQA